MIGRAMLGAWLLSFAWNTAAQSVVGKKAQQASGRKRSQRVDAVKLVKDRDDFWSDPLKNRRTIQRKLMSQGQEVVMSEVPAEVPLGVRHTLPVVVLRTATIANAAGNPFGKTAILTVVDAERNQTWAALAIEPPQRHTEELESGNREPLQEGMIGEAFVLDARKLMDLPWEPTKYIVTLILRDKPGPRLPVRLLGAEGSYKDPEVEKYKEQQRKTPAVPAVFPAPHPEHAVYERRSDTPPVPGELGISLAAPRVVPMKDARTCVLQGAFRLKVLPKHVVPGSGIPGAEELQAQYRGKSLVPTAVVPITVVATGSTAAVPFVFHLMVPTFDAVTPGEGGVATGNFAIDLQRIYNVLAVEQTLFLYAFSSEEMAGPVPIGFVR